MEKIKRSSLGMLTILAASTVLAGCTVTKKDDAKSEVIASYNGGKITQADFYEELKETPSSKTVLANMLIYDAFQQKYGEDVSKKAVEKEYQVYQKQYGEQFKSFLAQNNFTEKSLRQNLRLNLLSVVALKELKKVPESELKKQWENYQPELTVQHLLTTDEATAKSVVKELDNGTDFPKLIQEYSVDNKSKNNEGTIKLTATDKAYDSSFKDAAYKLKTGKYTTEPVKVSNGYEVIKLVEKPEKGKYEDHKKDLKEKVYADWQRNTTIMQGVIQTVLKESNIKITDQELKDALAGYIDL